MILRVTLLTWLAGLLLISYMLLYQLTQRVNALKATREIPATVIRVGGSDIAVDPVSGECYRLVWVIGTDHYPAALVTTDGVDCPYGIGNRKETR